MRILPLLAVVSVSLASPVLAQTSYEDSVAQDVPQPGDSDYYAYRGDVAARDADDAYPDAAPDMRTQDAPIRHTALDSPELADRIGTMTEAVLRSVMQMPIGPIVDAVRRVDPTAAPRHLPRNATVGDVANIDERGVDRMADNARAAGHMATGMAQQLRVMMPVMQAMLGDLTAQWANAQRDAVRR